MKKNAGFTLVELIVVIAILAILAGIAIPVYSGYIAKARQAADMQFLDSIKTAAVFTAVEKDPEAEITKIEVTDAQHVTVTAKDTNSEANGDFDISGYVGEDAELKYTTSATWTADDGWSYSTSTGTTGSETTGGETTGGENP